MDHFLPHMPTKLISEVALNKRSKRGFSGLSACHAGIAVSTWSFATTLAHGQHSWEED